MHALSTWIFVVFSLFSSHTEDPNSGSYVCVASILPSESFPSASASHSSIGQDGRAESPADAYQREGMPQSSRVLLCVPRGSHTPTFTVPIGPSAWTGMSSSHPATVCASTATDRMGFEFLPKGLTYLALGPQSSSIWRC